MLYALQSTGKNDSLNFIALQVFKNQEDFELFKKKHEVEGKYWTRVTLVEPDHRYYFDEEMRLG